MHRRLELELNFVISGQAAYLLPNFRFDVRRHSLCWLFPAQDHVLLYAWDAFSRAGEEQSGVDLHSGVEQALRILRAEDDPLTVGEIARQACLSASRLSHLFREQTGLTLGQFRDRQRLERFRELREGDPSQTLANCALRAGFGSYAQFYRVFKALKGCSPAGRHQK